ncbi:MAG TPA: hypothetical protein VKS79_21695, partial [Gemmataceae bacterium]|nr:hypothetical protein [Gemmataceae bacterium]
MLGSARFNRIRMAGTVLAGVVALLVGWLVLPHTGRQAYSQTQTPLDAIAFTEPFPLPPELAGVQLMKQTDAEKLSKSAGCVQCHQTVGDPHRKDTIRLGCTDC